MDIGYWIRPKAKIKGAKKNNQTQKYFMSVRINQMYEPTKNGGTKSNETVNNLDRF